MIFAYIDYWNRKKSSSLFFQILNDPGKTILTSVENVKIPWRKPSKLIILHFIAITALFPRLEVSQPILKRGTLFHYLVVDRRVYQKCTRPVGINRKNTDRNRPAERNIMITFKLYSILLYDSTPRSSALASPSQIVWSESQRLRPLWWRAIAGRTLPSPDAPLSKCLYFKGITYYLELLLFTLSLLNLDFQHFIAGREIEVIASQDNQAALASGIH